MDTDIHVRNSIIAVLTTITKLGWLEDESYQNLPKLVEEFLKVRFITA